MHPITIGTAGHIDHGKSALVRALTGIDPDRLAEEQRRGMTLDLGFAHLDLPGGRRVGIVDVPGHEALIHNMLAGAGGLDLVMLVVAADEGVMPQTREHVDILRFLRPAGGIVVLNKIDLVEEAGWLDAVEDEVRDLLAGSPLEHAPIVRVSARTGEGLADLIAALDRMVADVPGRPADGPVRLPIDRSFTMQGFGTVVTGTLWNGTISAGQVLTLLPADRQVRVRGLQVHGRPVSEAAAGSRVAVNLANVEKDEVARGDVLATPGAFRPTDSLEVQLRLLPHAPVLKQAAPLHFHLGSGSVVGRVVFVDRSQLSPGEEASARLRLQAPVVAVHGDRFVVRRYSPTVTLGGGVVLSAVAADRRRRRAVPGAPAPAVADPTVLILGAVAASGEAGLPVSDVAAAAGVGAQAAETAVGAALADGRLVAAGERLFARSVIDAQRDRIESALESHHRRLPWRRGISREELKSRATGGSQNRVFDGVLAELLQEGRVVDDRGLLRLRGFAPTIPEADQRLRAMVLSAIERGGASPPGVDELRAMAPRDAVDRVLQLLADDGLVVAVTPELRFAASVVEQIRTMVVDTLRAGGEITVASLRDRLQTSRRYALALLEYFDATRVTRRVGDRRVLGGLADEPLPRSRQPG
jgi:selenocysteine-specific elongation factor